MKKILSLLFALAFFNAFATAGAVEDWGEFETALRGGKYTQAEAAYNAGKIISRLGEQFKNFIDNGDRAFPVEGYKAADIDKPAKLLSLLINKQNDTGFFSGAEFAANDYLKFYVSEPKALSIGEAGIAAAANGIIIFVKKGSFGTAGGGNYLWLYNPAQNIFYYYGYLKNIYVHAGAQVKAGQVVASVRPSKKGFSLNFTALKFEGENFVIYNYLDELP